ncbi:hypothetical protein D5S17_24505 [Pseudonocardiaceae bacterium YIM PH 21723]|nr:hypothetical protein D5S17_24505 [Pseudonocardiaceae bacterium YIM PH 21723]
MFTVGLLGMLMGAGLLVAVAVRGVHVAPEGNLYKAAIFDLALGVYTINVMVFLHGAGFGRRALAVQRWALVTLASYSYVVETLEALRGFDPRFSGHRPMFDQVLAQPFLLVAALLIVFFLVMAVKVVFGRTRFDPTVLLGIRYAMAAVAVAMGIGVWMSVIQGSSVGESGSLLPVHAMGFHGLQTIPLVALLLSWSPLSPASSRRVVHLAGLSYLAACVMVGLRSGSGGALLTPNPQTALAVAFLLLWLACLGFAVRHWRRSGFAIRVEAVVPAAALPAR